MQSYLCTQNNNFNMIFRLFNRFLQNFRISKDTFLSILHILDLPSGVGSTNITPGPPVGSNVKFSWKRRLPKASWCELANLPN